MKKLLLFASFFLLFTTVFSQSLELIDGHYYKNDMLYSGTYTEYWPDKHVKMVQHIKNGMLDGTTELYSDSGKLLEQRSYLEGMKHGLWLIFNESGVKISEAGYRHDKKNGIWHIWNDDGNLLYEMYYSNGEKVGKWMVWDETGKVVMERQY